MDERRGERFGRYEILSELGRGAVGVVYKARDPKINRVVAIKTFSLSGQSPEDEKDFRDRFVREAEAAGRLSHPGIVTIFDVGEEPDTHAPYIVMEYVGGQSLDKVLSANDNRLPLETALQLTLELAEALDCAHGQGVVHRDLKPANILITEDGHAKIADFGVAKLNLANQTLTGRTLGTPAYMSPEQLNGDAVDGRSDLFSLGVVLYTVLTGYRPFQGNSAMTVSFKVVNREPVPATVLDTDLPPALDYVIGRAMAKDPAQRYQRGMELALDIQDLRAGREPWSRAKGTSGVEPSAPLPGEKTSAAKASPVIAARPALRAWDATKFPAKLIDYTRGKPFAAALFLVGLVVFGLRIAPLAHPKKNSSGNQLESRITEPLTIPGNVPAPAKVADSKIADWGGASSAATDTREKSAPKPKKERIVAAVQPVAGMKPAGIPAAAAPSVRTTRVTSIATLPPATLDIEIEHRFSEANLSIWVDSRLSYTHPLAGVDKKKLVVFHSVQGHEFHAMQVPPGNHQIKVQITTDAGSSEHSGTLTAEFFSGKEKTLRIHFDKHAEMNLSLE